MYIWAELLNTVVLLVVSETEIILKDLDQILEHIAASSKPAFESFVDREDNNVKEQVYIIHGSSANDWKRHFKRICIFG